MVDVNGVERDIDSNGGRAGSGIVSSTFEAKVMLADVRDHPCAKSEIIVRAL